MMLPLKRKAESDAESDDDIHLRTLATSKRVTEQPFLEPELEDEDEEEEEQEEQEEEEFVVLKILKEKIDENGVKKYLVRWQDYVGLGFYLY
jgi:hypothetical protein